MYIAFCRVSGYDRFMACENDDTSVLKMEGAGFFEISASFYHTIYYARRSQSLMFHLVALLISVVMNNLKHSGYFYRSHLLLH